MIGTDDKMTIQGWGFGEGMATNSLVKPVEQLATTNERTLIDSQVTKLIEAMAAFAPPAPGQTILPDHYQAALAPVLAASWT